MHGNGRARPPAGIKTRDFDDILREVETSFDVHEAAGTHLGGVHFELTGDDVTECIGGRPARGRPRPELRQRLRSAPQLPPGPGDGLPARPADGPFAIGRTLRRPEFALASRPWKNPFRAASTPRPQTAVGTPWPREKTRFFHRACICN